jgi:MFS family permease
MTYQFSDNREKYLGMGESAAGLGQMLGPLMGSLFYTNVGYFWAFIIFASFLLFSAILSFIILPNSLNLKLNVQSEEECRMSKAIEKRVSYFWFFNNLRSFFGLLTCTYVCVIFSFHASFFVNSLTLKGLDKKYHGLIVCIQPTFYVICTILVGYVIHKLPKRVFIVLSFLACAIAIAIMGPSYFLGFPNALWILIVG